MEKELQEVDGNKPVVEDVIPKTDPAEKSIEVSVDDDLDIFAEEKIKAKNEIDEISSEEILISEPQEEAVPDFIEEDNIAIEEVTQDDIRAIWYYNPKGSEYIQIYPKNLSGKTWIFCMLKI